jgi:glycosyltransferase involved in cell wall biosynthesis
MSQPDSMRIAIVSRSDESVGGASRAAHILTKLLRSRGHVVDHWVGYINTPQPFPLHDLSGGPRWSKLVRACDRASRLIGLPDVLTIQHGFFERALRELRYDIVHFHDTITAFSPLGIRRVARRIPTAMTFHDCAAFTGGCIYPKDCSRFETRCGPCPQHRDWPMSSPIFDWSGPLHDLKRRIHRERTVVTVAPCQWMVDLAERSHVFSRPTELLRYGVDLETLKPRDKASERAALGLPADRKILLFAASYLNDERKGFRWALQAHQALKEKEPPLLLALGHVPQDTRPFEMPNVKLAGFVGDMGLLARYYAAADLFVFPTMADNSPLVVLEAMASGTPTLAFATGGVPEQVVHGQTGYLAAPGNVDDLIVGMRAALRDDTARRWGEAARSRAEALFSYDIHVDGHIALYERMRSGGFPGLAPMTAHGRTEGGDGD